MTKTYYSASKGVDIPLEDMEQHHLQNAIRKFQKAKEAGELYPPAVLLDLEAELARRNKPETTTPATPVEAVVTPVMQEEIKPVESVAPPATMEAPKTISDVAPVPALESLSSLMAKTNEVFTQLRRGTDNEQLNAQLQHLAVAINALDAVLNTSDESVTASTPLSNIQILPSNLSTKLLVNSLMTYGVYTLQDLTYISAVDFGAVRFSTSEAFYKLHGLLQRVGLNWNTNSTILINDGAINPIINPNASLITDFVHEANSRMAFLLHNYPVVSTTQAIASLDRLFDGIKRRLALAVSVLGTTYLAQGLNAVTARAQITALNTSVAFKHQVTIHLTRIAQRVTRLAAATPPVRVLEDVPVPQ